LINFLDGKPLTNNVLDFETRKAAQMLKRKEAKVDELRKAFRLARGDSKPTKPAGQGGKRSKSRKK